MTTWAQIGASLLAAFLASLVECVEALTVVLAVASMRGWRSASWGVAAALLSLVCIALLGRSLTAVPLAWAQLVIGGLLLLFGLRWLRKAILRSAGILALHDETAAFRKAQERLRGATPPPPRRIDPVAFWGSFKIVLLEGVEVIFIIVAVASKEGLLWPACVGAAAALALVVVLGALLRRPLARIPENSLKFAVGVLLVSFGSFWLGEGLSLQWPHEDWSVLGLIVFYALLARGLVGICRQAASRPRSQSASPSQSPPRTPPGAPTGRIRAATEELIGLFVDDRLLAFGAIAWVLVCWLTLGSAVLAAPSWMGATLLTAGLAALLALSAWRAAAID
jgi:uncharacterized membrane protein